jgi:hypothetical protein
MISKCLGAQYVPHRRQMSYDIGALVRRSGSWTVDPGPEVLVPGSGSRRSRSSGPGPSQHGSSGMSPGTGSPGLGLQMPVCFGTGTKTRLLDSTRFDSFRLDSTLFDSIRLEAHKVVIYLQFSSFSIRLDSTRFDSIRLFSTRFASKQKEQPQSGHFLDARRAFLDRGLDPGIRTCGLGDPSPDPCPETRAWAPGSRLGDLDLGTWALGARARDLDLAQHLHLVTWALMSYTICHLW